MSDIESLSSIDMLIVDGPPQATQALARYPALPLLFSRLNDTAIIVLDDFNSTAQQEIVKMWIQEFNLTKLKIIQDMKGTIVLCKSSHPTDK
jgi:hypothetical protein